MTDVPHDVPSRTVPSRDALPVHEAAHLLGITDHAVRARLRRGTLPGVKQGGTWYVTVRNTDVPPVRHTVPQAAPQDVPERNAVHEAFAPLAEVIERQGRELAAAQAAAAVWQERARVLEGQLKQLSAGDVAPETPPIAPGSPRSDDTGSTGILAWVKRVWRG